MLAGAWDERSVALLDRLARRQGATVERLGSTALVGEAGAGVGRWRCWLWGRLSNAEALRERFEAEDLGVAIARAHAELGAQACDLLRGSFVLVAVDAERDTALVSRDHLGGSPLVYARVGGGALFAEHERDILDLLPHTPGPDRVALKSWVERGCLPAERTLYEGISRLPSAHRLVLSGAGVAVEPYWAPRYEGTVSGSREEIAERLRAEAFAAVDRAAGGSRRTAVRLSGGLDSACVAAGLLARGPGGGEALALSAVFPRHPETDERELIEATAGQLGLATKQISLGGGAPILPAALRHLERWRLPPVTPNLFVWEPVMALARDLGVEVMLDGEGGDELFGLAPDLIADMLRRGSVRRAWALSGGIPGIGEHPDPRIRLRALRVFGLGPLTPARVRRWRRSRAASQTGASLLDVEDRLALAALDDAERRRLDGPFWWRGLAATLTGGDAFDVSGHLRREAVGEEMDRRHPFLFDRDLVDAVLANPPQLQFDPVRDRALLRDALQGYIPEAVRTRHSKSHFTPLLVEALVGSEADFLRRDLARSDAPVRSFLHSESLDRLLDPTRAGGPKMAALRLWRVGMVDIWLRAQARPEFLSELLEKTSSGEGRA